MTQRTNALTNKKATTPLSSGLLRRAGVHSVPDQNIPILVQGDTSFGRDFSQVPALTEVPAANSAEQTTSCPVFPRTCPFGGACHVCPLPVQAKLKIGKPGDKYEQEADRAADLVMRIPEPQATQNPGTSRWTQVPSMNMQHRATGQTEPTTVSPIVHEVLRLPGQPLDRATRAFMEPRFRHDLSHVRVHTDARATQSAQAVNALAYTVGRDIVFDHGQYVPNTVIGKELLAHELAHTIQQGMHPVTMPHHTDNPLSHNSYEKAAETAASKIRKNNHIALTRNRHLTGTFAGLIQRQQAQRSGDCSGWESDPQSFGKVIADHYVRTELNQTPIIDPSKGLWCSSNGKMCEVHYQGGITVMVSLVRIPQYVIARQQGSNTIRAEYDYECVPPDNRVVFTRRP
jgi:hypothetical protein